MNKSLLASKEHTALFDIQANAANMTMQNFYIALAAVIIIVSIIILLVLKRKK